VAHIWLTIIKGGHVGKSLEVGYPFLCEGDVVLTQENFENLFALRCFYLKLAECKSSLFGSSRIRCYIILVIPVAFETFFPVIYFLPHT